MAWRDRLRNAALAIRGFSLRDPALARLLWGGGSGTAAGMSVSEDSALNIAAYWRGVNLISSQIAAMPLHLYKGDKSGVKRKAVDSKLYKLLHDWPNPEMSAFTFRETLQSHLLTWGNAYAEIEWSNGNQPIALWPLTPDRVLVRRDIKTKRITYQVSPSNRIIYAEDVLHIPGLGFDGLIGYSVIARARESLGLTAGAERYGASFFGNGASFGGILTTPDDLDQEQLRELRAEIERMHQGPSRAHKFLMLYNGMTYTRMALPPNEAQFLETRKMGVIEIARWLGVPPHKLFDLDRATFSNIEQQGIEYYTDTIWGWLERWEQELNRKLIPDLETNYQFFEFDFNGVMRTDTTARYQAYQIAHLGGWMNLNEIRAKENMNPIDGGDVYLAPMNMIPLEIFKEYNDKKLNPPQPKPVVPGTPAPGQPTPPKGTDPTAAHDKAIADANGKVTRAEHERDLCKHALEDAMVNVRALESSLTATDQEKRDAIAEAVRLKALAEEINAQVLVLTREKERLEALGSEQTRLTEEAQAALAKAEADRTRMAAELESAHEHVETAQREAEVAGTKVRHATAKVVVAQQECDRLRDVITRSVKAKDEASLSREASAAVTEQLESDRQVITAQLQDVSSRLTTESARVVTLTTALAEAEAQRWAIEADKTSTQEARTKAEATCQELEGRLAERMAEEQRLSGEVATLTEARAELEADVVLERENVARLQVVVDQTKRLAEEAVATLDERTAELAAMTAARDHVSGEWSRACDQLRSSEEAVAMAENRATAAEAAAQAMTASYVSTKALYDAAVSERDLSLVRLTQAEEAQRAAEQLVAEWSERAVKSEALAEQVVVERDAVIVDLGTAAAARDSAIAETQQAIERVSSALERLSEAEAGHLRAQQRTEELSALFTADHARTLQAVADRDAALADVQQSRALVESAVQSQATVERQLLEANRSAEEAERKLSELSLLVSEAHARALQAVADRDAALEQAEQARALAESARNAQASAEHQMTEANRTVEATRSKVEAMRMWAGRRLQWRRQGIVEAMKRMVDFEIEQVQKHQVTAEKLRRAVERFYPTFEDRAVTALRCWIGEHLAELGRVDDVDLLTRQLVREHIEQSKREIEDLIENSDDEARSAAVFVLVQRWSQDRPEAIANRLFQEEIDANVRRQDQS